MYKTEACQTSCRQLSTIIKTGFVCAFSDPRDHINNAIRPHNRNLRLSPSLFDFLLWQEVARVPTGSAEYPCPKSASLSQLFSTFLFISQLPIPVPDYNIEMANKAWLNFRTGGRIRCLVDQSAVAADRYPGARLATQTQFDVTSGDSAATGNCAPYRGQQDPRTSRWAGPGRKLTLYQPV